MKPVSNSDLENAIDLLGRQGIAEVTGVKHAQSVDTWRRLGVVPPRHCKKIVSAYKKKLKDAATKTPRLSVLNPDSFAGLE